MQVLNESIVQMRQSKNLDQRLASSQLAVQKIRELVPFHEKGLVTLTPTPQEWFLHIHRAERNMVNAYIEKIFEEALVVEPTLDNSGRQITLMNQVALAIEKYEAHLGKSLTLLWKRKIDAQLAAEAASPVDAAVDAAVDASDEQSARQKEKDRAIDQYLEALDILRSDGTANPEYENQVKTIEKRIRDLGGTMPQESESKPAVKRRSSETKPTAKKKPPREVRVRNSDA